MDTPTPLTAYRQAIDEQGFAPDAAQWRAATELERCHRALHRTGRPEQPVRGVYLWGPVGRGKTWLMDRFHQSLECRRGGSTSIIYGLASYPLQQTDTADPILAFAGELTKDVACYVSTSGSSTISAMPSSNKNRE